MLQECSGFATRPDGERWYNTQINQKYIGNIKQTSISNKSYSIYVSLHFTMLQQNLTMKNINCVIYKTKFSKFSSVNIYIIYIYWGYSLGAIFQPEKPFAAGLV